MFDMRMDFSAWLVRRYKFIHDVIPGASSILGGSYE